MKIKFGPAGLGGVKDSVKNLEIYSKLDLNACEIAFTYGVYIKNKKDAEKIKDVAKKFKINLTIHAPYWINLNSSDKEKIIKSKQRILRCLEVGTWLDAKKIVFHPGYYGKSDKKTTYKTIKFHILDLQQQRKKFKYTPELAPETTGKINVFGSIDEIAGLAKDTGCSFCVDFAHILARYKSYNFKEVFEKFKKYKNFHVHFSGIEFGEKGEKHHKITTEKNWKELLRNLPKNKDFTIINESPTPVKDSVLGKKIWESLKN